MYIKQFEIETGRQLMIDGLAFDEYTNKQRCEYSAEKENEKMLRVRVLVLLLLLLCYQFS